MKYHFKYNDTDLDYRFIIRQAGCIGGEDYFDLVSPRGLFGIVITGNNPDKEFLHSFNSDFQFFCDKNHIVAEYIRFDPWNSKPLLFDSIYHIVPHGYEYCIDLQDTNFFTSQFSSKRRNQVRKAQSFPLHFILNAGEEGIDILLKLYRFTEGKYDISDYYRLDSSFLKKYFELLDGRVTISVVYFEDEPITAGMFLNGGDVLHYHFSASNSQYAKLNAPSLMLYKMCIYAQKQGCKWLDLGGATLGSGLDCFKRSMVSEKGLLNNYVGTIIRNQDIYQKLLNTYGSQPEGYFPMYKRIIRDN